MTIASAALTRVVAHALADAPAECCGLLLGTDDAVVDALITRNIAPDPARFEIDPADHFAGRREARARGLEVIGFYHSHPHSAAEPSAHDLAEAGYPDHLYLIVGLSVEPPEMRLFRLIDRNFHEVAFVRVG